MLRKMKWWLEKQPLILPCTGLSLAIISVDSSSILAWISLLCILVVAASISPKNIVITFIVSLTGGLLHYDKLESQVEARSLSNQEVEIYGVVETPPTITEDQPTQAIINVLQGPEKLEGEKILAYIPKEFSVHVGEKVWLKGIIKIPQTPLNPQLFNKPEFLHRQGIAIELRASDAIPTNEVAINYRLKSFAESSRQWIRKKLTSGIENTDAAQIILAMFLGEKPDNDSDIVADFRNSGTIHVFAVSGINVMMIGLIFTILLRIFGCPSPIWIPSVIGIMFFYAIVTGMNPPVFRASIMGATFLLSLLFLRKASLANCLWLSGIIALICDSHTLFLPGFQLSYAVLLAIAFTGSWWDKRFEWISYIDPFLPHSLLSKKQKCWLNLRRKTATSLSVSTSSWFGSSLLIWIYFGLITPIAIIASLPLITIVFVLLVTCCLTLFVGSVSPTLGEYVNHANAYSANASYGISHLFASIPYSRYQAQPWSTGERVVIYQLQEGGGGAYLSLGGGILLDAGNASEFEWQILPSLTKNGARLDTLIASHPDIDHIQGLITAIEKFPIKQIIIPHGDGRSASYATLIKTAEQKGINVIRAVENSFPITDGVSIELIHAPPKYLPLADDRTLVFMLHWHGKRILFLNDSGHHLAHWLRKRENTPGINKLTPDVLVLGKHKLDDSLHPEMIELLSPKTIIATNSAFPPDQTRSDEWIKSIKNQGIELFLLDQSGAVTINQENNELQFETVVKSYQSR